MAEGKWSWAQRRELHEIYHWARQPVSKPHEYLVQRAVLLFLDGEDAEAWVATQVPAFVAKRIADKARYFLNTERMKRKMPEKRAQIIAERTVKKSSDQFTSGNIHVTMDHSQHRDYGMVATSIYCIVEVWEEDNNAEPEKDYLVNFSDFKTKEWLTKLLVWALMNKREVLIKAATQAEMDSMKMFVPKDRSVPA